ncbi:MAG TPA: UvrD-helicase domain-containing protein [Terriglobales bacterium]
MLSSSLLDQLNPQQRQAAEIVDGPILILAGAGSGKTRVITYRIVNLIENAGVEPDSILAVTFTNKAAAEMAERVNHIMGGRLLRNPLIATFHSFCVRVLRRDIEALRVGNQGLTREFAIYDEADQQQLVKAAMKRLGIDDKQLTPRTVLSRISWAKNHMLDPQEVYLNSRDPKTERIAHIYETYRQELRKANAMDFDDLLLETVRLLKSSAEVRHRYNQRYRYILIDEYQDTNRPQYELMKLLAADHHNVCVVGDEDQSIYSWRGADIKNILEFERDFPNAQVIRLEQNYRSTQIILEGASAVVANNRQRKGKSLWTSRKGGSKIGYYEAPDGENEALFAADYIARYLHTVPEGQEKKAAILYRTNSQSRLFEEALRRYALKYQVLGGFSFYERAEIKDMMSYLKLVNNPHDYAAFSRVVNTPARGIGDKTLAELERLALETNSSVWSAMNAAIEQNLLSPRACAALSGFKQLIDDARSMLFGNFAEKLTEDATAADVEARVAQPGSPVIPSLDHWGGQPPSAVGEGEEEDEDTSFTFGANDEQQSLFASESQDVSFSPEALGEAGDDKPSEGFRSPGDPATIPEVIKFLIDRSGYVKQLEDEATPEAFSRIENLQELVNAARDARDRGESLNEFLDHAALVSDTDQYNVDSRITLMTLHSAKGLEFPLVFLVGMEEGLFPHSRTLMNPEELEEERRLCYVGMTRAMDTLVVSRARYRRRYANDLPEASVPSRFLEEIPPNLLEDLSTGRRPKAAGISFSNYDYGESTHYNYEDEDQSTPARSPYAGSLAREKTYSTKKASSYSTPANSIDNIADFFASRGKKFSRPKVEVPEPKGKRGFRPGQRVRHPKYGEGTVYKREGEGEDAKITVQFPQFGLKKLIEKFAQLEKA